MVILIVLARIAQLVEQWTENPCVGGSIPSPGTTYIDYYIIKIKIIVQKIV